MQVRLMDDVLQPPRSPSSTSQIAISQITTSQIAIVSANVCPVESLDYEIVENDIFKQDWRSRKKKQIFQYIVLKWTLVLLIGLFTGLVGFFNNLAVENIAGFKLLLTSELMLKQSAGTSQHFWHMDEPACHEACKQVLMDEDAFVTGWPKATVALIGPVSFVAMPYDEHRRLRKLTAAPINGFDALTSYQPFIDRTYK